MLRCRSCGEVIGVYEPLIVIEEDEPRETSRAREPHSGADGSECFHGSCYLSARHDDDLPTR